MRNIYYFQMLRFLTNSKTSLIATHAVLTFTLISCSSTQHQNKHQHDHAKGQHCQSCAQKAKADSRVEKYLKKVRPETKVANLAAPSFKHMSFAGQPSPSDLEAAKKAGYKVIINLRAPGEIDWDEKAAAEKLGLEYYQIALLNKDKEIDADAIAKLEDLHMATHKQKQLIHCSSGNRAAAWMAAHLIVKHKLTAEQALQVARPLGVTKGEVEKKVERFAASRAL